MFHKNALLQCNDVDGEGRGGEGEEVKEDDIYLKFGHLKIHFFWTDRQTDRPTDRQTDRPTDRHCGS